MLEKIQFELTADHLTLMQRMNVRYDDECEFGAPAICPKRPYGNSDVYGDIGNLLNIKRTHGDPEDPEFTNEQESQMLKLHKEMTRALQVVLETQSFEPGMYEAQECIEDWHKA